MKVAGCQWLMPIIVATQEAEFRRIVVKSQPGQIVRKTSSQKRAGRVAQGVVSEFKPQYHKKKKPFAETGDHHIE
jgi:hypothetical protein